MKKKKNTFVPALVNILHSKYKGVSYCEALEDISLMEHIEMEELYEMLPEFIIIEIKKELIKKGYKLTNLTKQDQKLKNQTKKTGISLLQLYSKKHQKK